MVANVKEYIIDTLNDFDETEDAVALNNILVFILHEEKKQTKE